MAITPDDLYAAYAENFPNIPRSDIERLATAISIHDRGSTIPDLADVAEAMAWRRAGPTQAEQCIDAGNHPDIVERINAVWRYMPEEP